MKKMILAALLATVSAGSFAADKISFGVSATYPPFESLDAGNKIVGFDIDLANALCKQMQANFTGSGDAGSKTTATNVAPLHITGKDRAGAGVLTAVLGLSLVISSIWLIL